MGKTLKVLTLAALALLPASPAAAAGGSWAVSLGQFDVARDEKPFEGGLQFRFPAFSFGSLELTPAVGAAANEDESFWIYGALRYDFELSERWVVTPTVGVSFYEEGDGKDLGGPAEFRTGLEIAYRLRRGRLGVLFYHLSNAGLYDHNPGANSLTLSWAFGR